MTLGRPLVPIIIVPDEGCGPAMLALNPAQRAFVYGLVHFGCSRAEAARRAGYSKKHPGDAKVSAYRLFHTDEVQAAVIEESRKVITSEGPRLIRTLAAIRDDKTQEAKDRIKAAVELLNRGGLNSVSEHHLTVEHTMTDAQKDRRIIELCRELGLAEDQARKLLIAPDAIEGEFTEVEAEKTPEQQERAERYARTHEREKQAARRALSPEELAAHKEWEREQRRAEYKQRYAVAKAALDDKEPSEPAQVNWDAPGIEDLLCPVE